MTSISSSLSSLFDPLASSKAGRVLLVAIGVALGVTGVAHAQTGPGGVGNAGGTGGQPVNALWLRADKGISPSGGPVTTWADQSGNENDATQSSGNPTLLNNAFNGKPAVEFVASDQDVFRLSSTQLEDLATGNNTLIIVSKRTGNEGNQVTLNFDNSLDFGFIYSNLEFRSVGYNVVVGGDGGSGTLKLASMSGRFDGFFQVFLRCPKILPRYLRMFRHQAEILFLRRSTTLRRPRHKTLLSTVSSKIQARLVRCQEQLPMF
jgi:hypothetical protein